MKFTIFFLVVVTFSLSVEMGFSNEDFLKRGSRDLNGWKQLFNMLGQLTEEKNQDEEGSVFPSKAASYQRYQGAKLAQRFNAFSYWYLSKAMDSHNVGRNRKMH